MDFRVPKNQSLSGSDHFHLLLDRNLNRNGLAGNVSRIHLAVDASTDLKKFEEHLLKNKVLSFVSRLGYKHQWPTLPKWVELNYTDPYVSVHNEMSEVDFNHQVVNRKLSNASGLVHIDLCQLKDGSKHVLIAMHHVLFDHRGMTNFLQALNEPESVKTLFPSKMKRPFFLWMWDVIFCAVFVLSSAGWKLGSLISKKEVPKSQPVFRQIQFTKAETVTIEKRAWDSGARLGKSPFYIAAVAKIVNSTLKKRGENPPYLWFSVPSDQRRKGNVGHLISNQLSFLFFKLKVGDLVSSSNAVKSVNTQLKNQIKKSVASRYISLLEAFRRVPMPIYNAMVNLSTNGQVSSFGFSDLGEEKQPMEKFCGAKVLKTINYPPVPCPPGFNVVVKKEQGELKFIWAYYKEAINSSEIEMMEKEFRKDLLGVS